LCDLHKPMASSLRLAGVSRAIWLIILFGALAGVCVAGAPPNAPTGWNDGVRELADKIAAMVPASSEIDFSVNNLSSLNADQAAAISEQLKAELTKRGFHLATGASGGAGVTMTLSEGTEGYLLVAQVRQGEREGEQVAIVSIASNATNARIAGGVTLGTRLVWEQAGEILDFALTAAASDGDAGSMIVLEPRRVVFYVRRQGQWQVDQAVIIPPARPWLRTARGHIDISRGLAAASAGLPGIECKGDFGQPQGIQCGFVSQDTQAWIQGDSAGTAAADLGGDVADVSLACDGRPVKLATGKEDWTHPDSIQAFELSEGAGAAVASGNAVEFGGPVIALWPTGEAGVARAVVHDLKTGNYEAYVVIATCSQ
jgi:hypothetical protein